LNTTVVICSANRPHILAETVQSLISRQSRQPREIVISVYDEEHVAEETKIIPSVRIVLNSRKGLTVQRNAALSSVQTPYTLFLDDDVEIASNYIESMESLLDSSRDVVAATGFIVADGAQGDTGLDREFAKGLTVSYRPSSENCDHQETYGCNIFARASVFSSIRFDENLPLYGWLEDYDFATNCLKHGKIILNAGTCVAHLATPTGRTSGLKFGYSQIINPLYLWRKNDRPTLLRVIFHHWVLSTTRNLRRTLFSIPSDRDDRTGRFRGNVLAFGDLLKGRIDPTRILRF